MQNYFFFGEKILDTISDQFWITVDCAKTLLNLMDSKNIYDIYLPTKSKKLPTDGDG